MRPSPGGASRTSVATGVLLILTGLAAHADNWPGFRGASAGGVGRGAAPTAWDVATSRNVAWKTPVPGFAISSPVVWDSRVYVTTAVSQAPSKGQDFRQRQVWKLLSLDRATGKVVWERTVHAGVPYMQRHPNSSYANATPATDGRHIVALFETEMLACFDMNGGLLWKKPLQVQSKRDAFIAGSSPIIVDDMVVVQDDRDRDSSMAAYRLTDGTEVWKIARSDGPSQSTPVLWTAGPTGAPLLIVLAQQAVRALDARTGREVWHSMQKADYPAPSVALAGDLAISAAGEDLRAFRAASGGDSLPAVVRTTSAGSVWTAAGGGTPIPSPLVFGDQVFVLAVNGVLTGYEVRTGRQVSRQRATPGEYCASPVAAGGNVYVFSTEGNATVLRAGPSLDVVARNQMGEKTLATPAVADGTLYVRTAGHLIALR